jgi:hypothetical protein
VKVFGNGSDIFCGQCELWHGRKAGIVSSIQDYRTNQFAGLIRQHHCRPKQIGSALIATTEVGAVTQPAVGSVESIAACDQRRIARWALLRGKCGRRVTGTGHGRSDATAIPSASTTLRWCSW